MQQHRELTHMDVSSGSRPDADPAVPQVQSTFGRTEKASRRNFSVMLIDAIGYFVGISFFSPQTTLQEFVTRLTTSNVLIGLTTSIAWGGMTLTQLFVANYVGRLPIKKWYVVLFGAFERLPLLVCAIVTPILAKPHPMAMLVVVFALLAAQYLFMGCILPSYSALYSKVIPPRQRGLLFGSGIGVANVLKLGTGLLIPFMLVADRWWGGFPNGFALCFLIGFIVLVASYIPLAFADEPREAGPAQRTSQREYARALWRILRHERDFQLFAVFG